MRYFSKTKNKTAEKITGQCFPVKSRVTCKNLTHLAARKERPKKSLTLFMHAHLQLFYYDIDLPNFGLNKSGIHRVEIDHRALSICSEILGGKRNRIFD